MNKIKKGDEVVVIAGKDKGKTGKILSIVREGQAFIVEGINIVKKMVRANPQAGEQGGIKDKTMPIDRSNVMLYDANKKKGTRVGIRVLKDGQRARYYKSSGELVDAK